VYGFSAQSFWLGGGLESHCVGCVYGADGDVRHHPHSTQQLSRPPPIQKLMKVVKLSALRTGRTPPPSPPILISVGGNMKFKIAQ